MSSAESASAAGSSENVADASTTSDCQTTCTLPNEPAHAAEPATEPKLPPLTPAQFREYNRLSEHMNYFHNHFRSVWNMMYKACETNKRPSHLSLKNFINEGLHFIESLTMHHGIEEAYVFPMLARKMPEFKAGKGNGAAELLRQHREIHKGMDGFEAYLKACKGGERELELPVLKEQMDTWGTVLWTHLDQEVKTLGADNMRKYWTLEEMKALRM